MLHSTILELFDYLTHRDHNKKISLAFIMQYKNEVFKNPKYEKYFKAFVDSYEGREERNRSFAD